MEEITKRQIFLQTQDACRKLVGLYKAARPAVDKRHDMAEVAVVMQAAIAEMCLEAEEVK